MTAKPPGQAPTRRLIIFYVTALSAVALISIFAQVTIERSLVQQASNSRVINLAGRQRMLGQKLSKAALAIEGSKNNQVRQAYLQEIQE
ncbi:MAG: hypothetical protein F6K24_57990, partial [Okeania sp. SIO2D1]|nr:hypothetical protein [Okeania sp. SIO2D1]